MFFLKKPGFQKSWCHSAETHENGLFIYLFLILLHCKQHLLHIWLGFYGIEQQKVVYDWEVKKKDTLL